MRAQVLFAHVSPEKPMSTGAHGREVFPAFCPDSAILCEETLVRRTWFRIFLSVGKSSALVSAFPMEVVLAAA